jgi:hypothetical protein
LAFSKQVRARILAKTDGRCTYCGHWPLGNNWHVEHMWPKSKPESLPPGLDGPDDFANLWPSCPECNHKKGARDIADIRQAIKEKVLYLLEELEDFLLDRTYMQWDDATGLALNTLRTIVEFDESRFFFDELRSFSQEEWQAQLIEYFGLIPLPSYDIFDDPPEELAEYEYLDGGYYDGEEDGLSNN